MTEPQSLEELDAEILRSSRWVYALSWTCLLMTLGCWLFVGWFLARAFALSTDVGLTAMVLLAVGSLMRDQGREFRSQVADIRKGWPR